MVGETNAEGAGCRFEAGVEDMEASRDDSKRAREKMSIEIVCQSIERDVLLGHGSRGNGDCDLTVAVTLIAKELIDRQGIGGIGGKAITSFGGVDDELTARKRSDREGESLGGAGGNNLHGMNYTRSITICGGESARFL